MDEVSLDWELNLFPDQVSPRHDSQKFQPPGGSVSRQSIGIRLDCAYYEAISINVNLDSVAN